MPAWMLDTVALIDYYHGRPGVLPYLYAIQDEQAAGAFSTITELVLHKPTDHIGGHDHDT